MKTITIVSKKFGTKSLLLDDDDFELLSKFKWSLSNENYAARQLSRKNGAKPRKVLIHRIIMGVLDDLSKEVDHIDGNGLNNQKSNLRICTHHENLCNQKNTKGGTSKYKGVYFDKSRNKWASVIKYKGKGVHIGRFKCETIAAIRYNQEAKKLHGEFAHLNRISG